MTHSAPELLNKAAAIMTQRGAQYDKPEGERSMAATVAAFNAITNIGMTEPQGWLLMALLKMVRDNQREVPHQDSCEDLIAYAALYGEARMAQVPSMPSADAMESSYKRVADSMDAGYKSSRGAA